MKAITLLLFLILCTFSAKAQVEYGTPEENQIPTRLKNLPRTIMVNHFPQEVDPIKIENTYYWKHTTSILCKKSDVTIVEYGAYLFYNNTWNLRKSYPLKELDKTFGTEQEFLAQSEPYTWAKNYRTDERFFGGWALWYFIGKTATGELICGYKTINTTTNLLN